MIGEEIRSVVFRDTTTYYHSMPEHLIARQLMWFIRKYAGASILDLGCATGNYSAALMKLGYAVKGADVNSDYVKTAKRRGIDAVVIDGTVPFPDKSFDTVICFEVIEHVEDLAVLLSEAKRLAQKNVLFTTPNSEHVEDLIREGLMFEHFAELDHKNFFTQHSLNQALSQYFPRVEVMRGDGINPLALFGFRPLRLAGKILTRLGIMRPKYHFRLFAVCSVE